MPEPIDREELRRLHAEATPEPWKLWDGWGPYERDGLMRATRMGPASGGGIVEGDGDGGIAGTMADLELAAVARNAIIPLLDTLEAAEAERDRYRAALEEIAAWGDRVRKEWEGVVPYWGSVDGDPCYGNYDDAHAHGQDYGLDQAATIARAALEAPDA